MAVTLSDLALFVQIALLPLIAIAVPLVAGYPRVSALLAALFACVMLLVYARRRWQRRQMHRARAQTVPMTDEQTQRMHSAAAATGTSTSDRGAPPSVERPSAGSGSGSTRTDTASGSEVRKPPSVTKAPPPPPAPGVFIRIPPPIENMEPTLRGLPRPADAMRRGPPAECVKVWQAMLGPGGVESAIGEHLPDVDPWMPPAPGNEPSPEAPLIVPPYAMAAEAPEYPYPVQRPQALLSAGTKDAADAAPSPARSPPLGEAGSRSGDERPGAIAAAAKDKAAKGAKDILRMFGPLPSPFKENDEKPKGKKKARGSGGKKKSRAGDANANAKKERRTRNTKDPSPKKEGRKSKNKGGKAKKGSRKIDVTAAPAPTADETAGNAKDKPAQEDNDNSADGGDK